MYAKNKKLKALANNYFVQFYVKRRISYVNKATIRIDYGYIAQI